MDPTPPSGPASRRAAAVDAALVDALQRGDETAWRTFLIDHHAVFERSLRLAVRRAGARFDAGEPTLVDDAKVYFYEALRRGFRDFQGEGQFFAFLHRTVQNFVFEKRRGRAIDRARTGSIDPDADDGPLDDRAASVWRRQRQEELDPALSERLDDCLLRLPDPYRSVVLLHHFEAAGEPLQTLASLLGATVEAIHKRHQRALAMLRECLKGWRQS